ncbi:MAG: hypothetical protein ACO3LT_10290 [Ilumatobacteraceae bacterium]
MKSIEESIIDEIRSRQVRGLEKYGCTVADNPLETAEWIQHAIEEALDLVIYLRRLQVALKEMKRPDLAPRHCPRCMATVRVRNTIAGPLCDCCEEVLG